MVNSRSPESKVKLIDQVRKAALYLQAHYPPLNGFGVDDLADHLGIQTLADKDKLRRRQVAALVKSGELVRVQPGKFKWAGKPKKKPTTEERMYFVLYKRGEVTGDYLAQMADTSLGYALEFLGRLKNEGVVHRLSAPAGANYPDKFRLVGDPGPEMPPNLANAEKCRRWREQKKEVIASLDAVYTGALDVMQKAAAARLAVSQLEEG